MLRHEIKCIIAQDRLVRARVVPIPLETYWCVDVVFKDLLTPGSRTEVLEEESSPGGGAERRDIARFASLDLAARALVDLGVSEFEVDVGDAISFVEPAAASARPHEPARAA